MDNTVAVHTGRINAGIRHGMEILSALLALYQEKPSITNECLERKTSMWEVCCFHCRKLEEAVGKMFQ